MSKEKITYKDAGVDIDQANAAKREMADILQTKNVRVLNKVGAFASLIDGAFDGIKNPVLVMKTEEPGSKQKLAFKYDKVESICFDMINHLIDDIIVMGARPLAVQDAIICGKLEKDIVTRLVRGMHEACEAQDCALVGGETSEQPGVLDEGMYILTSCIIGVADKDQVVDGSKIQPGDQVIAVASNGPHTNGYTLLRALMAKDPELVNVEIEGETFIEWIMRPHTCYYQGVKGLFGHAGLKGMAHITGGGIKENLDRVLPDNVDAVVDLSKVQMLPIFPFIQDRAGIDDDELLRTYNCGVGLTVVCSPDSTAEMIAHLEDKGFPSYVIGEIEAGSKTVRFEGNLQK